METFSDKTRAYVYALLVHLAVLASLFIGLLWTRNAQPIALAGAPIEATIVGKPSAPAARPQSKAPPAPPKPVEAPPAPTPPQPAKSEPPAPAPAEVKPPPTVQKNDNIEQEKIAEIAEQKAEEAKRAQEEKHHQQQILLDQDKKREEAEAKEKARQADIQKQLEDIRKQRDDAAKKTRLAMEKMKQLDDLQKKQESPPAKAEKAPPADVPEAPERKTGMNGADTGLQAEYVAALQKIVKDNWNRPDTAAAGVRCAVRIIQIPGGTVLSASISSPCNADSVTQNSIIQAVTKAQPLPFKGYESVFQREITFNFRYDGN